MATNPHPQRFMLILDDEGPWLRSPFHSLASQLSINLEIHVATSAVEAFNLCEQIRFDVIVCDLNLGLETKPGSHVERLIEMQNHARIYTFSAYTHQEQFLDPAVFCQVQPHHKSDADALFLDVLNHLKDPQPISARPPGIRKKIQRNVAQAVELREPADELTSSYCKLREEINLQYYNIREWIESRRALCREEECYKIRALTRSLLYSLYQIANSHTPAGLVLIKASDRSNILHEYVTRIMNSRIAVLKLKELKCANCGPIKEGQLLRLLSKLESLLHQIPASEK